MIVVVYKGVFLVSRSGCSVYVCLYTQNNSPGGSTDVASDTFLPRVRRPTHTCYADRIHSGKRNATVWRLSVRLSLCSVFLLTSTRLA